MWTIHWRGDGEWAAPTPSSALAVVRLMQDTVHSISSIEKQQISYIYIYFFFRVFFMIV